MPVSCHADCHGPRPSIGRRIAVASGLAATAVFARRAVDWLLDLVPPGWWPGD